MASSMLKGVLGADEGFDVHYIACRCVVRVEEDDFLQTALAFGCRVETSSLDDAVDGFAAWEAGVRVQD